MNTEPLSQQIWIAIGLFAVLLVIYLLPSNAEIAAGFRRWKAMRTERKSTRRAQLH